MKTPTSAIEYVQPSIDTAVDRPNELPPFSSYPKDSFPSELRGLINRFSLEGGSDTPDYILAEYLKSCLDNFNMCIRRQECWVLTEDQLPPRSTKVLAAYHNKLGMARLVVGEYVRSFDVESTEEDCEVDEYSDVYDAYYLRAGWYEQHDNFNEYASTLITEGKVTHWMLLPKLPYDGLEPPNETTPETF